MSSTTAQRQTVQTNEFVLIRQFLHKIATASVRTGFAMTIGVAVPVIARSEHPQGVRRIRKAPSSETSAQATWQSKFKIRSRQRTPQSFTLSP